MVVGVSIFSIVTLFFQSSPMVIGKQITNPDFNRRDHLVNKIRRLIICEVKLIKTRKHEIIDKHGTIK